MEIFNNFGFFGFLSFILGFCGVGIILLHRANAYRPGKKHKKGKKGKEGEHHPRTFLGHELPFWGALAGLQLVVFLTTSLTGWESSRPAAVFAAWVGLLFAWRFIAMLRPHHHGHGGGHGGGHHGPEERDTGVEALNSLLGMFFILGVMGWLNADEYTPMYPPTLGELLDQDYWQWLNTLASAPWTWIIVFAVTYNPRFKPETQRAYYFWVTVGYILMGIYALGWFPFRAIWEQFPEPQTGFWHIVNSLFPPHY